VTYKSVHCNSYLYSKFTHYIFTYSNEFFVYNKLEISHARKRISKARKRLSELEYKFNFHASC